MEGTEVGSRRMTTPACEDADAIKARLAELQRERDAARGWQEPSAIPTPAADPIEAASDAIEAASDAIVAAWDAALQGAEPICCCVISSRGFLYPNELCPVHGRTRPNMFSAYEQAVGVARLDRNIAAADAAAYSREDVMPDLMPLDHAYDALSDAVTRFHNEMLRCGIKSLPPLEWAKEFASWFSPYDFAEQYRCTLKNLAEWDRREAERRT